MPDQYMNFSNPTIIPSNLYGNMALEKSTQGAIGSLADYYNKQLALKQQMQYEIGSQAIKDQLQRMSFGMGVNPGLQQFINNNPYTKNMLPNMPDSGNNSGMGMPQGMTGLFPFAGGYMQMGGNNGMMPPGNAPVANAAPGIVGASLPNNTVSPTGDVNTSSNVTMKSPFGSFEKTMQNIPAQQALEQAKGQSKALTDQAMGASETVARDKANLDMVTGAYKNIMDNYNTAKNHFYAGGGPQAMLGHLTGSGWNPVPNPEGSKALGKFQASQNELITKMQPILSQQFGKEGSSRIMESMLKMTANEVPQLSDNPDYVEGKVGGSINSLYRFLKGSANYASQLGPNAKAVSEKVLSMAPADVDNLVKGLLTDKGVEFSPEEQAYVNHSIDYVMGRTNKQPSSMVASSNTSTNQQGVDIRSQYNQLRASGISAADAKKQLGL